MNDSGWEYDIRIGAFSRMKQETEYFVFNVKDHNKGRDGSILWYKPEAMGYTDNLQDVSLVDIANPPIGKKKQ